MTDPTGSGPDRPAQSAAAPGADLGRRRFFREFAAEVVGAAAQVVGVATALQQSSSLAAGALLDPVGTAARATSATGEAPTFRTAFRWEADRLIVIDQRRLPEAVVEVEARSAAEVAQFIRDRVVIGEPLLGQLAAIALALTAERVRGSQLFARRATVHGSGAALKNSSPASITVRRAVERLFRRLDAVEAASGDGPDVAAAFLAEAEAIVAEATAAHGRIAELGAIELQSLADARTGMLAAESAEDRLHASADDSAPAPLRILTLGATGVIAGGQFGTALSAIVTAAHQGLPVHVTVAETRPLLLGSRLTAWELAQAGVPHALIADSAAGGLLARGAIDVLVLGADRIAANGDVEAVVGAYPLAVVADRHHVPVLMCAPLVCVDLQSADGGALPLHEGPMADVQRVLDRQIGPAESPAIDPLLDVTPGSLVSALVTEAGVLRAPYGPAVRAVAPVSAGAAADAAAPMSAVAAATVLAPATAATSADGASGTARADVVPADGASAADPAAAPGVTDAADPADVADPAAAPGVTDAADPADAAEGGS